jgi:hypothetical protein
MSSAIRPAVSLTTRRIPERIARHGRQRIRVLAVVQIRLNGHSRVVAVNRRHDLRHALSHTATGQASDIWYAKHRAQRCQRFLSANGQRDRSRSRARPRNRGLSDHPGRTAVNVPGTVVCGQCDRLLSQQPPATRRLGGARLLARTPPPPALPAYREGYPDLGTKRGAARRIHGRICAPEASHRARLPSSAGGPRPSNRAGLASTLRKRTTSYAQRPGPRCNPTRPWSRTRPPTP